MTWLLSTVTVVVLLFGYKTSTGDGVGTGSAVIPSAAAPATDGSDSASSSGSTSTSDTVSGDAADTQWGPVQVAVSVADGKVTDVQVVEYPSSNPRDEEINSYALPILIKETLSAQSADIDMVSGATVTSDGYIRSLQSALDQAGV
ncbi:FMN-binding domain-containing protein [Nocardioides terrae]|uniref:FMN-binding domain-containing protein n=1 Tax=Nocardioides terrae TaxID=574651 RepID=A0A1I1MF43_9ACTN|nr:FMN-binding protein [Nocardioides terrae]SFC84054.1 FMN-binding domain-containing protein [Nocardioides terrae]